MSAAARLAVRDAVAARLGVGSADLVPDYSCPECGENSDGAHGRPGFRLDGCKVPVAVSYARRQNMLVLALSEQPVELGVDIEDSRAFAGISAEAGTETGTEAGTETGTDLDAVILTPAEVRLMTELTPPERNRLRAVLWTRKEAVLKAVGCGLRAAPSGVGVGTAGRAGLVDWPESLDHPGPVRILDLSISALGLPPTFAAALAVLGDRPVDVRYS